MFGLPPRFLGATRFVMEILELKRLLLSNEDPATGRRIAQYKVAGDLGIHPTTLSQYALGDRQLPWQHRRLLAQYFDVPEDSLDQMVDV
jgi:hypothetical protein